MTAEGNALVAAAGEVVLVPLFAAGPRLGQVAFLAGPAGSVPELVGPGAGGGQRGVQPGLLLMDGLAAGLPHASDGADRPRRVVVVIQVLVGQATQGLEEGLRKEPALLEPGQGPGVRQQTRQQVLAAGLQPVKPAEVVEPVVAHAVELSVRQRGAGCAGRPVNQRRRPSRRCRSPCCPAPGPVPR